MQEVVMYMGPARIEAEKWDIQHVGYPGQGVPVAHVVAAESPFYAVEVEARANIEIVQNIVNIVILDIIKQVGLAVEKNQDGDVYTNDNDMRFVVSDYSVDIPYFNTYSLRVTRWKYKTNKGIIGKNSFQYPGILHE